jgi:hypothetical protein
MRIWRRKWIIKRIALGFAVAALVAPGSALAKPLDMGTKGQESKGSQAYIPFVTDFPSYAAVQAVNAGDYGMPRAMPNDYATQRGDLIEVVRTNPRSTLRTSDVIENVRLSPRDSGSTVEASPGFDWSDAGIGAGLAVALLLAGGLGVMATRHLGRTQTA